jgi:hypothetical protein
MSVPQSWLLLLGTNIIEDTSLRRKFDGLKSSDVPNFDEPRHRLSN